MRWQVEERCARGVGASLRTALRPHYWMFAVKLPVRKWLMLRGGWHSLRTSKIIRWNIGAPIA
jgi:hypothetical protein